MEIKLTLEAARRNVKLKQADVAKVLNVNIGTVLSWEKGYTVPDAAQAAILCELYDVKFENLIFLPKSSV
jgi:DNA-binding transcriptional regulator YiaG